MADTNNIYVPYPSKIKEIIKHTEKEWTFRMSYIGEVRPGQFYEVSVPKYGEASISVSGIGEDFVDLTIRRVGRVTEEVFKMKLATAYCSADHMEMDLIHHYMKTGK